ncbi:MAG: hypothetical protein IT385_25285 [Deltaproteobacteria bacterium]|nr:hypothetical protein [Deltaproteobacteria bacterium]
MTFVVGTLGDDRADRVTLTQARSIAERFPGARVVRDDEPAAADARRVVYGGPHTNAFTRDAGLPFELGPGRLALGGEVLEGPDLRIITVVPADVSLDGAPRPSFLLYAGTVASGSDVIEINAVTHGGDPILVADTFGKRATGRWVRDPDGSIRAELGPLARRIGWRDVPREVAGGVVRLRFPDMVPAAGDEAALVEGCLVGVRRSADALGVTAFAPIDVYVYPDRRSKQSLTGEPGAGHAVVAARALHVLATPSDLIAGLLAHEATHVLAVDAWGLAGMPLLGEGLAVWASGRYGDTPLADLTIPEAERPALASLVGWGFRMVPERIGYTFAGHLVAAAIELAGVDAVRDHLYGATPSTWPDALKAAGLDTQTLEREVARRTSPRHPESDK